LKKYTAMKRHLFFLSSLISSLSISLNAQVLTIAQVQGGGAESPYVNLSVTVKGAVTGVYSAGYFMRDSETAWSGIYVYEQTNKPSLGDTIQITGTVTEYYTWTELKSLTAYKVISTGNPAPEPVVLFTGDIDESWESCFVLVKKAKCTNPSLPYTEWAVDDGSGQLVVHNLAYSYTPQLDEKYNITGNVSFDFGAYKIEPRFAADVQVAATIFINSEVYPDTIEKNRISLSWTTNFPGSTELAWGTTPAMEMGSLTDTTASLNHSATIEGLVPANFYYVRAFSVNGTDTTRSAPILYSTVSESSGEIRVCFNRAGIPPKESDAPGTYTSSMIDTMVAYVNLAQSTLDLAIYDWTNFASFSDQRNLALVDAINAAFQRGVIVRFMTDAKPTNEVLANLDPAIPILKVKTAAIMHDKFFIVDAESASNSWLITGSTNPTYNNLVMDLNNLVAIQDQSVAKAYALEFNEMYGSIGESPDTLKSLIGSNKKDNTPHHFLVNGKRIEVYFSPSDLTTGHIISALNKAETRIDFAIMAFTEDLLGNALVDANARGVKVKGIIDYIEYSGSEYPKLVAAGINVLDYMNPDGSGWPDAPTLHHKFAVVDAGTPEGTVITGSHNWTASAESKNDENTLIIHDEGLADLYRSEVERIYRLLKPMTCNNDTVELLDPTWPFNIYVTANDTLPASFGLSIVREPEYGTATVEPDFSILYDPQIAIALSEPSVGNVISFYDTIVYQVCHTNDPDYCLQASVFIKLDFTTSIRGLKSSQVRLWPNPVVSELNVQSEKPVSTFEILDLTGKSLRVLKPMKAEFAIQMPEAKSVYLIRITADPGETLMRKVVKY
jgi:phosphatidylserine/phosphatidylglycerophosphate/cardiolipin synthase-like enzyme